MSDLIIIVLFIACLSSCIYGDQKYEEMAHEKEMWCLNHGGKINNWTNNCDNYAVKP